MAKAKAAAATVTMLVTVARESVADVLTQLADLADSVTVQTNGVEAATASTDDEEPAMAPRRAAVVHRAAAAQRPPRLAGRVIYTPVGTAKQIGKLLDSLRGENTMRALVLKDLAKHPGSANRDVRERLAKPAKAAGLSVESVDNVIWQLVNKGVISKAAEAAD